MTELHEMFEDYEVSRKRTVIIDGHNIAYRNLYSSVYHTPEDNGVFDVWRYQMLMSIFYYIRKLKPDRLIIAFDKKGSWRYDIYSDYKANRKVNRKKGKIVVDFTEFYKVFDKFVNDFKQTFSNVYIIDNKRTEGDDIMAVLGKKFVDDDVILISNDSDLHQLMKYSHIRQYDPKKDNFVECLNPTLELEMKILQGDSSDFIKGIHKGVGPVKAKKISDVGFETYMETLKIPINELNIDCTQSEIDDYIKTQKQLVYDKYKENTLLINLEFIPDNIVNAILDKYNNYEISEINSDNIIRFFARNKLARCLTEWTDMSKHFKKLS